MQETKNKHFDRNYDRKERTLLDVGTSTINFRGRQKKKTVNK